MLRSILYFVLFGPPIAFATAVVIGLPVQAFISGHWPNSLSQTHLYPLLILGLPMMLIPVYGLAALPAALVGAFGHVTRNWTQGKSRLYRYAGFLAVGFAAAWLVTETGMHPLRIRRIDIFSQQWITWTVGTLAAVLTAQYLIWRRVI